MSARAGFSSGNGESPLLDHFRDFYQEVVRWKSLAAREGGALSAVSAGGGAGGVVVAGPGAPSGALMLVGAGRAMPPVPAAAPAAAPATVWQALLGVLSRQEAEVRRSGGEYASAIYRRAQYVMAALADEIFLYLDWPGREAWRTNLLEFKLFQTYRAGEEVFRRIEALLRTRDPADAELAKIYLMALALGFRGELRGPEAQARIDWYRRELYTFLTHRDPGTPREPRSLFPEAYQSTAEASGAGRRLSAARRWLLAGLVLALLWIIVSHRVWIGVVEDLAPLVDQINQSR
ncbi:MAG: DotU family type IV/VI secretion system protein [Thermoanaerobaculia bacterium]